MLGSGRSSASVSNCCWQAACPPSVWTERKQKKTWNHPGQSSKKERSRNKLWLFSSPPPSPGGRNSHLARKESRKWHSESFPHFFLIFVSPPRFPLSTVGVASHRDDTSCLPTSAEKLEARKKKGTLRNRKWLSISREEKKKGGGVRSVFFCFATVGGTRSKKI